jgi:magnesium chelatase subunit I
MKQPFPFSAIVGQDDMKLAMVLTAIDPSIAVDLPVFCRRSSL